MHAFARMETKVYKPQQWNLSGLVGISDQTLEMHFKLYEGYVKATNELNARIAAILSDGKVDQEEMPAYSELTRRLGFEYNGMVLHEYYFGNMKKGGGSDAARGSEFRNAVERSSPSYDIWRTEFVRVGNQHALIRRIVVAAEIDTVIDTRLAVDSIWTSPRAAHENNVIGTMNIVTACGGADSPVRKFVFKSSSHFYCCERDDPAYFTEQMSRPHPPSTPIERDIVEAEEAVSEFARRNP